MLCQCTAAALALPVHGRCTAAIWPVPGRYQAGAVLLPCQYKSRTSAALPGHGRCSAKARPVHGRHLAGAWWGFFDGTWPLLCQCTAAAPPMQGHYPAATWPAPFAATVPVQCRHPARLLCRYLAASLPMHGRGSGRCAANARPLSGRYVRCYPASAMPPPGEAALPLPGHFSASARPLPHQCYAATRPLPGRHLGRCSGNTRPPRGRYFDRHLSRHQAGALLIRQRHVFLCVKHFDVTIRKYYTSMNGNLYHKNWFANNRNSPRLIKSKT